MSRRNLTISSPNYYVTITANNRIKIWELHSVAHTNNEVCTLLTELFEANYLKIDYTAIAIFDDDQNINNHNSLLVLGDKSGRIVLFNITKACKVLQISHDLHSHSSINCVKFDVDLETSSIEIVSCSNDKRLCRWDLNGKLIDTIAIDDDNDDMPLCLAVTHPFKANAKKKKKKKKKYLMIACNHIGVWNITNKEHTMNIGSFQGHAHNIRHLLLSDDNLYLISSAHDRFVYIWKCKSFYKKKKDVNAKRLKSAQHSLALDDDVISIDICTGNKQNNVYYIAAASKCTASIWCFDPTQQQPQQQVKPVVEITIAPDDDSSLSWIQGIQFMNDSQLMVLRGNSSLAIIKQIGFVDVDNRNIVLENVSASLNMDLSANHVEGELETQQTVAVDKHLTVLHVADVSVANPMSYGMKRKRENAEDAEDAKPPTKKQKMTFEDRLYEIERKSEQAQNKELLRIPNADSLYTLLTQSLGSNDQSMFERLLTMQNDEVMREFEGDLIANTLNRISCEMAVDLLQKLSEKYRVSPRQSISILRWLLPLLNSHCATFSNNVSSRKHLISIHQAIDYQIKSLLPTMKLQGRLALLMNQMEKVTQFTQNDNNKAFEMTREKPLFVHDEHTITHDEHDKDEDKDFIQI